MSYTNKSEKRTQEEASTCVDMVSWDVTLKKEKIAQGPDVVKGNNDWRGERDE